MGLALGIALISFVSSVSCRAQAPTSRTTPERVYELIDAHIDRAKKERNSEFRQRLLLEGYASILFLPPRQNFNQAGRELQRIERDIDDATDGGTIRMSQRSALRFAEKSMDVGRVEAVARAIGYNDSTEQVRDVEFESLLSANNKEGIVRFLEPDNERDRQGTILALCSRGRPDMAGYVAEHFAGRSSNDPDKMGETDIGTAVLAEAGGGPQLESLALQLTKGDRSQRQRGIAFLTRLAIVDAHQGHGDEVRRLTRMMLNDPVIRAELENSGLTSTRPPIPGEDRGKCEQRLWKEWPNWSERSIRAASMDPSRTSEPSSDDSPMAIVGLANALAGTGFNPESVELIDRLIAMQHGLLASRRFDVVRNAFGGKALAISSNVEANRLNSDFAAYGKIFSATAQLLLARFAAGGEYGDATAKAISADRVEHLLFAYPHSEIARRILMLSTAEMERVNQTAPSLDLILRFDSLIREGRSQEARALAADHPTVELKVRWGDKFLSLIAILQNAGMQPQAVAMLDAYLELKQDPDDYTIYLLLKQQRADRAKAALHALFDGGYAGDVFTSVMVLRELGESMDFSQRPISSLWSNPYSTAIENWLAIMDALAWHSDSNQIERLGRNPPVELSTLAPAEADCVRSTVTGLQAIALARRGDLEGGYRLIMQNDLKQRAYCFRGWGDHPQFEYGKYPIFDLRYLVHEWVERGHAAN